MNRRDDSLQPALHRAAEAIAQSHGNGPLSLEPPLDLRITYDGVIARLADHDDAPTWNHPEDMPMLSLPELSAALRRFPEAITEAVEAEVVELQALIPTSLEYVRQPSNAYALVGLQMVSAWRRWLLPLVLDDVRKALERHREWDALEDRLSHCEIATPDQEVAIELGLGSTLS